MGGVIYDADLDPDRGSPRVLARAIGRSFLEGVAA